MKNIETQVLQTVAEGSQLETATLPAQQMSKIKGGVCRSGPMGSDKRKRPTGG